jgi:Ca2+-transporting ATPase
MAALLRLDVQRAHVVRNGQVRVIDAADVVPGDVAALEAGQHVPADGRLLDAHDLRVDEAALTGESLPVTKRTPPLEPDTPLADRVNMVYKGTTIAAGSGLAVITATGAATELGKIGALTSGVAEERTPLERRLDVLGGRLVWLALGVAALVAALGALQGAPAGLVIEMGIALAVAAVPEALPAVATIALAVGVSRMARRRALVRRLPSVEALGSTTVICTDKTRTLTSGDMTVVRVWASGEAIDVDARSSGAPVLRRLFEVGALASKPAVRNDAGDGPAGDPVDAAILSAAARAGIDRGALLDGRPQAGVVPFSSDRKLMAAFHREDGSIVAYAKGAPRTILDRCGCDSDGSRLDDARRAAIARANDAFAAGGLRVLALASGRVREPAEAALADLTFAGLVGLMDPPAAGVKETIQKLKEAGLRTVMLTGDQALTAAAVGRELGLVGDEAPVLTGREVERLSPDELRARVDATAAYSRITPAHKLAIVTALQQGGAIVAMLGDGVNDAAALRKADVGVAMGLRGTDVAKEAASIVLQDDRFETIAAAVEEGRVIFDNIRKFVFYLFSCNVAEVFVLLVAGLAGLPLPLLPLQLLWMNMITDTFPALALAMEPAEWNVMQRPPRDPQGAILSRAFLRDIAGYAALITGSTLAAFLWSLRASPPQAVTVAFMTLALAQTFHLGNARRTGPVLRAGAAAANPYAIGAVALSVALQLIALYVAPLARTLHVVPLSRTAWLVVLVASVTPAVVGQTVKVLRARRGAAAGPSP